MVNAQLRKLASFETVEAASFCCQRAHEMEKLVAALVAQRHYLECRTKIEIGWSLADLMKDCASVSEHRPSRRAMSC